MATLKDVARAAGVSVTTASIVANGKAAENRITDSTVQRVLAVMDELRYVPNHSARLLRSQAPHRPYIGFFWAYDTRVNMLGIRLAQLQRTIQEQELDIEISVQFFRRGHIAEALSPASVRRFDGIIAGATAEEDIQQLEALALSVPIVLLNRNSEKLSTVGVDNTEMGKEIASLIKKKGYTECAIVRSRELYSGVSTRMKAFLAACAELGIETRPEWTFSSEAGIAGGARAVEEYVCLAHRPRVLFFESDTMAQGGLFTLKKSGIRVPGEVELITVGTQLPEALEYLTPAVSAVSIPQNVERQAMFTMIRLLREKPQAPVHIRMAPQIQLRESFTI